MFHSDKPINTKEYDCLNRTTFSKQLAQAIMSYTTSDNFAISLCGKWGSGKTSILNMVVEEINVLTSVLKDEEKPVIVKFNPWNYSDCAQLISQFFVSIQSELKIDTGNKGLKSVGEALESYSSLLDYSVYIPVIGPYLGPLKGIVVGAGKHIKGNVEKRNNIEEKKKNVIDALKKQKHKFIIIIDDIDRLNNSQIRAIFQLVNSLAGFPNMIYLLSFDREVVARALQEEQKCDGEEYLEKIIQVPFEVPEANKNLVNEVFINRISNIIFEENTMNESFDSQYWSMIFGNCISPFIESIRDVNRVVNAFGFKYKLMCGETNAIDLLALTTLQVCAPTIFQWIYNNADYLTGSVESAGGISGVEQKENYNKYLERFKVIYPENPVRMINILQSLFPKFSWITGGYNRNRETNDELRFSDRIASSDRICRYFNLSLEEIIISKKQIQETVSIYTKEQLSDYFVDLLQNDKLTDYLQELLAYIPVMSQARKSIFLDMLLEIQMLDEAYERKTVLSIIPASKCRSVMIELFKQSDEKWNLEKLLELIKNSDKTKIGVLCEIVEVIEEAYGRLGRYHNSIYQFIQETDLNALEMAFLEKAKLIAKTENYFEVKEFESIYRVWELLEKESLDSYIVTMLQRAANVPKYLSLCVNTWHSGRTEGWNFKEASFSEYITKELAFEMISSLKNTEDFRKLEHSFKRIAVAFCLWYGNENQDYHDINREKVDEIIGQWEKS